MKPAGPEILTQMAKKRGQPFRVLIVDDEKWVQEVFRDFCDITEAFNIDLASSGDDALQMIRENNYDLVTLDLIMPDMSGLEALSAIKEISPDIPIVVITGNATGKLVNEAGVMGACRVMYKPVLMENFMDEVASALQSYAR